MSCRSVPSASARATASALPSPLTRNHTALAAVERGEGQADALRRRLGGVGDADRDRVVDVELRVAGEQRGDVAVGADAEHHDVELAVRRAAQLVAVRRGALLDARGRLGRRASGAPWPGPRRPRRGRPPAPGRSLRSSEAGATNRSSPHQTTTRDQSTSRRSGRAGPARGGRRRRWCRRSARSAARGRRPGRRPAGSAARRRPRSRERRRTSCTSIRGGVPARSQRPALRQRAWPTAA